MSPSDTATLAIVGQHLYRGKLNDACDKVTECLRDNRNGKNKISKAEFAMFANAAKPLCAPQPFVLGSLFENIAGTSKNPNRISGFNMVAMSLTGAMSPDISGQQEVNGSEFSPYAMLYAISRTEVFRHTKPFPISFLNEHIDERLQKRAGITLDFSDTSILESLQLSLAFLYVMGPELSKNNIPMLPLLVPHRNGLLLGHIETSPEGIFLPFGARASRNGDEFKEYSGIMSAGSDWKAKARVYFKTFIGENEVAGDQERVIERWQQIIGKHQRTINEISDAYTNYEDTIQVNEQGWKDFMSEILELYRSPEWQQSMSYSVKHLPNETYASLAKRQYAELVSDFSIG